MSILNKIRKISCPVKQLMFKARLVLFLFISCIIVFFSSVTSSAEAWKKDDTITSNIVCLSEETILEVARQDTISFENGASFVQALLQQGRCVSFMRPTEFQVDKVLLTYKDHLKRETLILQISYIFSDNNPFGFVIALQRPSV